MSAQRQSSSSAGSFSPAFSSEQISQSFSTSFPLSKFRVACIQLTSTADMQKSMDSCESLIRKAVSEKHVQFIVTPENTPRMSAHIVSNPSSIDYEQLASSAYFESNHPAIQRLQNLAKELSVWILMGSAAVRVDDDRRLANRSLLISSSGAIIARYDKIHMFDVPSLDSSEGYLESARMRPGSHPPLVSTPFGQLGMTVCYDLRFPHLYRLLAQSGAHFLSIPSAFTVLTGKAHWHVLLRSRAIESSAYVFAAAQCGQNSPASLDGKQAARFTYGHSLIVDPWGQILSEMQEDLPGYIVTDVDLEECVKARKRVPQLQHDRQFQIVKIDGQTNEKVQKDDAQAKFGEPTTL